MATMTAREIQIIDVFLRKQGFRLNLVPENYNYPQLPANSNAAQQLCYEKEREAYEGATPYRKVSDRALSRALKMHMDNDGISEGRCLIGIPIVDITGTDTPELVIKCDGTMRGFLKSLSQVCGRIKEEDLYYILSHNSKTADQTALKDSIQDIYDKRGIKKDICSILLPLKKCAGEPSESQKERWKNRAKDYCARLRVTSVNLSSLIDLYYNKEINDEVIKILLDSDMMIRFFPKTCGDRKCFNTCQLWTTMPVKYCCAPTIDVDRGEMGVIGSIIHMADTWNPRKEYVHYIRNGQKAPERLFESLVTFGTNLKACSDRLKQYVAEQLDDNKITTCQAASYAQPKCATPVT